MRYFVLVSLIFLALVSLRVPNIQAQNSTEVNNVIQDKNVEVMEKKNDFLEVRKSILDEIRMKRDEAKEEFRVKRDEFRAKLQLIKDERKKLIINRIDSRLTAINIKATDHMAKVLEKLTEILDRIENKTSELSTGEADVTSVQTAITNAKDALATAQAAVTEQAGKEYVASITDETTLRSTMGAAVSQLRADLKIIYQAVLDAKKAVRLAAVELAKVKGLTNIEVTQ